MVKKFATLFTAVLFSAGSAFACSVCFGGADSNMQRGFYWGVIVLGALPFLLLALLVGAVIYSIKKQSRLHAIQEQ